MLRPEIKERMEALNKQMFEQAKKDSKAKQSGGEAQEPAPQEPTDILQRNRNTAYEESKKVRPRGTSRIAMVALNSVLDGDGGEGLVRAYKRAKNDSDALSAQGDRQRADIRRQQYMNEYFLPAVELVVNSTSPDEVLNSKQVLTTLDKYVLLLGSGRGYTASYIRQAYGDQLGQREGHSDAYVASEMRRLNRMLDNGEIRTAVGIASKLKRQIDNGEKMASDNDYNLIGRVVAYYA